MALVILNMPAMPWHRLFTAEHLEAKQRFPFKAKSHYENPEEKVSLACRVHSSFLLLLNKLLVTFKNRTKMKKPGQKCCPRRFSCSAPLDLCSNQALELTQGRRGKNEAEVRGVCQRPGARGDRNGDCLKKLRLLPFRSPGYQHSLQQSVNNCTECCTGIWTCFPIPCAASFPMLMFFSFPILNMDVYIQDLCSGCVVTWHFQLKT